MLLACHTGERRYPVEQHVLHAYACCAIYQCGLAAVLDPDFRRDDVKDCGKAW